MIGRTFVLDCVSARRAQQAPTARAVRTMHEQTPILGSRRRQITGQYTAAATSEGQTLLSVNLSEWPPYWQRRRS